MNSIWLLPTLCCYLVAAAAFIADRVSSSATRLRSGTFALGAGVVTHAAALAYSGLLAGNIPVTDLAQSISFLAALTAIAGFILIVWFGITIIGVLIAPLVSVATAAAALSMRAQRLWMPISLRSFWLPIHVTLAFAGFAMFVLAASVSLIYLIYERRLKAKRPVGLEEQLGPSLEKLDRINYRLLGWGFLMLSLAIISGAIWADATWGRFWSWEPQESWSLAVWLMYAALLESRLTAGWRGRRVATLTLIVFTVLIGSFVGVSLVTPGKHSGSFG